MIRTYSNPLIVLSATKKVDRGTTTCEVIAETTDQNSQSEMVVTFVGKRAESACKELIKGARFTYRGIVQFEDRRPKLIGITFSRID